MAARIVDWQQEAGDEISVDYDDGHVEVWAQPLTQTQTDLLGRIVPTPCCRCCEAAAERGELDHVVGLDCPYPRCDYCQPTG